MDYKIIRQVEHPTKFAADVQFNGRKNDDGEPSSEYYEVESLDPAFIHQTLTKVNAEAVALDNTPEVPEFNISSSGQIVV